MCETATQEKMISVLERIERAIAAPVFQKELREPQGALYFVGNTQSNWYPDYKGYRHIYVLSANAVTLNLQDLGTLQVPAGTWTEVNPKPNVQIFATNQATAVPIWVLATDDIISGAYAGGASITNLHNADNQAVPTGNAELVDSLAVLLNVLGKTDRQREVGADAAPSDGIVTSANNLAQTQSSNATGAITAGQTTNAQITPTTVTSAMVANNEIDVDFGTTNVETGFITAVSGGVLTVAPANGSPAAPSWLNAHSGTYKIQVKAYNVARDAKGENSGADGTGTSLALEYEWGAGGPPLASGAPSLDQYDRETLIVGQGKATGTITSTNVGDTSLTFNAAPKTLTPGHPIRLSGAATPETVYVDQSFLISASATSITLKHPVVNAGQTTATWQQYAPNGPGKTPFPLYGEGMEGIVLNDPNNAGQGVMMQANEDGTLLITASGVTTTQTSSAQTNLNAKGVIVWINMTNVGTGSVTVHIQGEAVNAGVWTDIAVGSAQTGNGLTFVCVYPGASTTAPTNSTSVAMALPRTWRVQAVANNANATTYTVEASVIL